MEKGIEQNQTHSAVPNPFGIESTVSQVEVRYEPVSVQDRLIAIGLLAGGASVLYFLGSSVLGLSFGTSCSTLGLLVLLGKLRKKVEQESK